MVRSQRAVEVPADDKPTFGPAAVRMPPLRWREPVVFDVFDPDGRYLGEVRAPEGFSLNPSPYIRGDRVWAVVRDELDVSYVVRFRVVLGGQGGGEGREVALP